MLKNKKKKISAKGYSIIKIFLDENEKIILSKKFIKI